MPEKLVYCSGPLFSPEERAGMLALSRVLQDAGHETFLPQRDGLESVLLRFAGSPLARISSSARRVADRAIFALDVFHLVGSCSSLVFNMNGRVPDEGAAAEAAIAYAVGTPVILYKQDARSAFDGRDNSMLLGLSPLAPIRRLEEIPRALGDVAPGSASAPARAQLSEPLRRTVEQGERINRWLERVPTGRLADRDQEELVREIGAALEPAPGGD